MATPHLSSLMLPDHPAKHPNLSCVPTEANHRIAHNAVVLALLWACLLCGTAAAGDENLTILTDTPDGVAPGKMLEVYLRQRFYKHIDDRQESFAAIKSKVECRKWQTERREFFLHQIGGLPERTPLNARIVGQLDGEGYRVEKVIFESRPGFHVTANLYLPKSKGPYPGAIIPCGHSHNGKAAGGYQRIGILLARQGIAALCYDPIGQGERYQMLDFEKEHEVFPMVKYRLPVPHPRVQYLCTQEHTAIGIGCILLGSNVAQYRIWDGMRAVDYLQSRDDIIAQQIGCTGNSGGGTMTAYLMALDDRIVAAVPVCYLTTFRKLIDSRGAQDGEQNIFGQVAFGMDQPDYVMMRAPKPTLIGAGRRDATFDIDGTWDLFRQSKEFYARLGYPERVDLNDADLPHGFHLQQREAAARWLVRWLLDDERVIWEVDPASLPDPMTDVQMRELNEGDWAQEDLYCTPQGQVLLMEGERSTFQINAACEEQLAKRRTDAWKQLNDSERRTLVRATIDGMVDGTTSPTKPTPPHRSVGTVQREGYTIERLAITPEPGIELPALAFVPKERRGPVILYLHGESMKTDAAPGGPIEQLVKQGHLVLAAELRGIGETETGHDKNDYGYGKFGRDVQEIFLAYLLGRSYVGMRTADVAAWSNFLQTYQTTDNKPNELQLVAIGEAAIPALHAAALEPERYASVRLCNMVPSWAEVVRSPDNQDQVVNAVHGALQHYDLPDLVEMAGADKVQIEAPVDALGKPLRTAAP